MPELIKAQRYLKMRTIFIKVYAAGLRVSEMVKLATEDIDLNFGQRRVMTAIALCRTAGLGGPVEPAA